MNLLTPIPLLWLSIPFCWLAIWYQDELRILLTRFLIRLAMKACVTDWCRDFLEAALESERV